MNAFTLYCIPLRHASIKRKRKRRRERKGEKEKREREKEKERKRKEKEKREREKRKRESLLLQSNEIRRCNQDHGCMGRHMTMW